jgi:hypothetical protein
MESIGFRLTKLVDALEEKNTPIVKMAAKWRVSGFLSFVNTAPHYVE